MTGFAKLCALLCTFIIITIIITSNNDIQTSTVISDNDYVNHYVDIEITGYRVLYSKTIAGRDVARLFL